MSDGSGAVPLDSVRIPGVELLQAIGHGSDSVVYLARRGAQQVVVKMARSIPDHDQRDVVLRFRREAATLACLEHPSLPKIFEVGEASGYPYLISEYMAGPQLAEVIKAGPLPEHQIVSLAIDLAEVLTLVHQQGTVHRDLKPQNILVDASGHARVVDFGFAVRLGVPDHGNEIAGTLLYSPPEQVGMLRRPIDGRSDLYALGVILFECAVQHVPFHSDHAADLALLHLLEPPPDLSQLRPDLSPALVKIIGQLLAKDPDDRYQTGDALAYDLRQLVQLNAALARGESILLGSHRKDDFNKVGHDPTLIGREHELSQLMADLAAAAEGHGRTVLVEGPPGSGKSRLIRELLDHARPVSKVIMSGKCLQGHPVPLAPLREAVDSQLARVNRLPEAVRNTVLAQIRKAVGELAPVVKHLSPGMFKLLPDLPAVIEPPEQFHDAIAACFASIAGTLGCTVLFIDDVQWLDESSFQVLTRLATMVPDYPFYLITAARNDSDHVPALQRFCDELGTDQIRRVVVNPLPSDAVARLVREFLGDQQVPREVIGLFTDRSGGNPMAVREYVRAAFDAGLLRPSWGKWIVDLTELDRLHLSADLVQLLIQRVDGLHTRSKQIMQVAAVIGLRFPLDLLSTVTGGHVSHVHSAIEDATRLHLIERRNDGAYVFIHDRVREALLSGDLAVDIRVLHQQIASALEQQHDDSIEHRFALAHHYAQGQAERHAVRVAETNLEAGMAALGNFAYAEAYDFLSQAYRSASLAGLPPNPRLEEAIGEACAGTDRIAEAQSYLERAIQAESDPWKRARLWERLGRIYMDSNYQHKRAWWAMEQGLHQVGLRLPKTVAGQVLSILWHVVLCTVTGVLGWSYGKAKGAQRERTAAVAQLYLVGMHAAFFDFRPVLFMQAMLRGLHAAQLLGPSRELITALTDVEAALGYAKMGRAVAWLNRKVVSLNEAIGHPDLKARGRLYHGYALAMMGDGVHATPILEHVMRGEGRWIATGEYIRLWFMVANAQMTRGYNRESRQLLNLVIAKAKDAGTHLVEGHLSFIPAAPLLASLGHTTEGLDYLRRTKEQAIENGCSKEDWGTILTNQLWFHYEQGDLGAPFEETVTAFARLQIPIGRTPIWFRQFYLIKAHGRLAQYMRGQQPTNPLVLTDS